MTSDTADSNSTPTVIALLFIWVILVLALVYFYKRLNADTNGQYTIQRAVFSEGGLRDRLRQGVGFVENRFGVNIWPRPRDEDEEVMQGNDREDVEEEDVNDKQNESHADEDGEQESGDAKDDSSDDYSSIDLRERLSLRKEDQKSVTEEEEEKEKQNEAAAGEEATQSEEVKNEEKVGLLIDLKPFAGSAIWSEENKDVGNDLTAL
ncbi:retrotransposon-like protein 1 [Myxocyprinus asiaticus]|uniref:retrotransposon-like protein 1 n=1 Tax=Myxocyprinus asiaticus TaxID=70543 RepID=UPI002221E04E|nr:retrotransposon-like protein 1 [Myxocyprinus asiaticus]